METVGENHDYQLEQVKKRITMEHNQLENTKSLIEALAEKMENAGTSLSKLQAKQNKVKSDMREYQKMCHPGYAIAFDNVDIHVKRRDMTLQAQNKDIHWVNHIMLENRVSGNCLSTNQVILIRGKVLALVVK
jgi:chromosome segregation ATPase